MREKSLEKIFGEYKNAVAGADLSARDIFFGIKATHEEHLKKDYGTSQEKESAEKLLKEEREKRWHLIENHGEAYIVADPEKLEPDVLEHEQMKKEFFDKLEANKEFWELFQNIKRETKDIAV